MGKSPLIGTWTLTWTAAAAAGQGVAPAGAGWLGARRCTTGAGRDPVIGCVRHPGWGEGGLSWVVHLMIVGVVMSGGGAKETQKKR